MPQKSAGILMYRRAGDGVEVLLVHPGGPMWRNKDVGAWSIPKGLYDDEEPLVAARREFCEETGAPPPEGAFIDLGVHRQPSGKRIAAFAVEGDFDVARFASNTFPLEWPPRSGRIVDFPEADRAGWFAPDEALRKIAKGQAPILRALFARLGIKD